MRSQQTLSEELDVLKSIYTTDYTVNYSHSHYQKQISLEYGFQKSIRISLYPENDHGSKQYCLHLDFHIPKLYPQHVRGDHSV
jgi:RWD domain